ncbi:MAG: metallophosphoesterase, partial [Lutibacter sp.]|uniref:metallophosphoesterase n=1 Tax=Lutibacter sp. TaxID=1925666 RepID=UPI00385FEE23
LFLFILTFFFAYSCATYDKVPLNNSITNKIEVLGTNFFLIGDAGFIEKGRPSEALNALNEKIKEAKKEDVLLFLGDNIYPKGMPSSKSAINRKEAEESLLAQLNVAQIFKGKVLFISGNHDWYSGVDGLREQQKMVEKALGKKSFLPKNGCPLNSFKVLNNIIIITVDSEWYITDWDKHPKMNDNCEIKTRTKFIEEFKSLVNKNQGKTIILAMHHPIFSNGNHGGQYAFNQYGLPILNIPINIIRRTSGIVPSDLNFPLYRELSNKITTILQEYKENVIVVSGHEHNLQYVVYKNIPQIISGSGSKVNPVRHFKNDTTTFEYASLGYAILNIQTDKQQVSFFNAKNQFINSRIIRANSKAANSKNTFKFPSTPTVKAAIYTNAKASKNKKEHHYKDLYLKKFEYQVVNLDTLYGGLTPIKLGGGNQSVSLRLEDKVGKEYVMRRLRKSATQFIQVKAFQENYMKDQFKNTAAERFLMDFYTTSYPFAALVTGNLSDIVGVYHSNSEIFYVPKQPALQHYNAIIGNDLFLFEERSTKDFKHLASFGNPDDIVSTDEVMNHLMKDEKYQIDHSQYIKTRLFDMWLGDWDRHEDQYRWATFKNADGTITYAPIPRDRDQAFPKFDGFLTQATTNLIPALRLMQSFGSNIKNVKTFNQVIYKTDMMLINQSSLKEWIAEANFLEQHLTDAEIEKAFANFPSQLKDENIESIKSNLKKRRSHIISWAKEYFTILNKNAIIIGTNKDDTFEITRLENGDTRIKVIRNKKNKSDNDIVYEKIFSPEITKEIWLYGLNDKDHFIVNGLGKATIKILIIGGQNKDTYTIENSSKIKIYDYKSNKSIFEGEYVKRTLTDDYDIHNFNHHKFKHHLRQILPSIGYNPDDGLRIGTLAHFTKFGFENNPFSQKHSVGLKYFTATNGFEVSYKGEFSKIIGNFNLGLETMYTTPAFSQNFFGFGNETVNLEDDLDIEYYRTRLEQFQVKLSLIKRGSIGSLWNISVPFQYIKPNDNNNRFVEQLFSSEELNAKKFIGIETTYSFLNKNNHAFSTLGIEFNLAAGWTTNLEQSKQNYAYVSPSLQLNYPIIGNEILTLSTLWKGNIISNSKYEFYQASNIGGKEGLRGFRNERFSGKSSYYQNTDLRLNVFKFNAGLVPAKFGVFGGYDYGRVWLSNNNSNKWHSSVGGGIFVNGAGLFTLQTSYFSSDDGGRFMFGLGFGL